MLTACVASRWLDPKKSVAFEIHKTPLGLLQQHCRYRPRTTCRNPSRFYQEFIGVATAPVNCFRA